MMTTSREFETPIFSKHVNSPYKLNQARMQNKEQQNKFQLVQRRLKHIQQQDIKSQRTCCILETQLGNILQAKIRFDEQKKHKLLCQDLELQNQQAKSLDMFKKRQQMKSAKQFRDTMYFQQMKNKINMVKDQKVQSKKEHLDNMIQQQSALQFNKADIQEQLIQAQVNIQNHNKQKLKNMQGLYKKLTSEAKIQTQSCLVEMDFLEKKEEDLFASIQRSQNLYLNYVDEMNAIQKNTPIELLEQFSPTLKPLKSSSSQISRHPQISQTLFYKSNLRPNVKHRLA